MKPQGNPKKQEAPKQPPKPASKEDMIKQMIQSDPQKAAELLREFLKNR